MVGDTSKHIRVRFFKKIQDWILKSERIRKRSLCFFTKQINPRSLGSWFVKGSEESTSRVDSLWTHSAAPRESTDHCDDAYSLSIRVQTTLNHIRFVKLQKISVPSHGRMFSLTLHRTPLEIPS